MSKPKIRTYTAPDGELVTEVRFVGGVDGDPTIGMEQALGPFWTRRFGAPNLRIDGRDLIVTARARDPS